MATNFCPSCGASVESNATFCAQCGSAIPGAAAQTAPPSAYAAPVHAPAGLGGPSDPPLSVGQFLGMMVLSGLPLIGFILILVWAFGSQVNQNKKNYARAFLILAVIGIALSILFSAMLIPVMTSAFGSMGYDYFG